MVFRFEVAKTDPDWLIIAKKELGVKEVPGHGDNPRVIEYHKATSLKATKDEVPWCSAFANWCLNQAGYVGTNDAMARSFTRMPAQLIRPVYGCIGVLWRGARTGSQGHVGFVVDANQDFVTLLGGNQRDSVCIEKFPMERVLGYYWPVIKIAKVG